MGTAFEELCQAFLRRDPVQVARFCAVQSYGEWTRQRGLPTTGHDGIDLVAELRDEPGCYAAIRCKLRGTRLPASPHLRLPEGSAAPGSDVELGVWRPKPRLTLLSQPSALTLNHMTNPAGRRAIRPFYGKLGQSLHLTS